VCPQKKKKKSEGGAVNRQNGKESLVAQRRSSSASRASSRASSASGHLDLREGRKELSIEERLDIQLQQIMKSKSKLAIAMERVSADMHIKKRDREIVKMRKDLAEGLHTIHTQRDELIRLGEDTKEKDAKLEELKKRNFKLLQKQRTFDEMKRMVASQETPENAQEMELRVKKEVMAKVERTIVELKHQKQELTKEVKAEKDLNHKANLVISELEREMTDVKETLAAAEDQVRYVMAEDERNVQRLNEMEAKMKHNEMEMGTFEESIRREVEARLDAENQVKGLEVGISKLRSEKNLMEETTKELALQIADLENTKGNAESILFEQSKKHAMAAEKVGSLQREVKALEAALKRKHDDAEDEAMLGEAMPCCHHHPLQPSDRCIAD